MLGPAPGGDGERARQARTVAGARSRPASDSLGAKGQGRRGVWACESGGSFLILETEPRAAVLPTAEPGSFWPGSRPSCGRVGATWWDPWPRRARAGLPATSRASGSWGRRGDSSRRAGRKASHVSHPDPPTRGEPSLVLGFPGLCRAAPARASPPREPAPEGQREAIPVCGHTSPLLAPGPSRGRLWHRTHFLKETDAN